MSFQQFDQVKRASVVVIDDRRQGSVENRDLIAAVREKVISWEDVVELGHIVTGKRQGRENSDDITIFESQDIAIQDVAAACHLYNKALESGAGERVGSMMLWPLNIFLSRLATVELYYEGNQ